MNEEPASKSSLNLTLTQQTRDEDLESWEVHACLEYDLAQAEYYCISSNFHTLVILLQVDLVSGDELEIVYEGCYKIEDTFIFAWFSIPGIGHYCWLCDSICRRPLNIKADYLVRTIQHILDFL